MGELNEVIMFLGICIGILAGGSITVWAAGMAGFLSEIYKEWHDGMQLADLVKEKKRERRAELLAKMIELQRAMQPVPSEEPLAETPGQPIDEMPSRCSDSSEKGCDPLT